MVKALSFKGDKKVKKRKRPAGDDNDVEKPESSSTDLVTQTTSQPAEDNAWVSADAVTDVAGPIIFVLPTKPATCLACDANGKVFASPIENMIEDEPSTAEPHDVRQVWIANRVAGTQSFSFKGHHGKYLGCDKFGILTATNDAISPEESFICIPDADAARGTFSIQTSREKCLFADSDSKSGAVEIRGDAAEMSDETTFRIRMQARFKPTLKAEKIEKAREKISRSQLEAEVGRKLEDDEVKKLKRARKDGTYHEAMLDVKVKNKHDKYA